MSTWRRELFFLLKKHLTVILSIIILMTYSVSLGDEEEVTVHVSNGTAHFVHVFVSGTPFLYVRPGGSVRTSVSAPTTVVLEAVYAPGQGISGQAKETSRVSLYVTTETCGRYKCNEHVSPSVPGVEWTVTAERMPPMGK